MFPITQSLKELVSPAPSPDKELPAPVVTLDLTRECNLKCLRCDMVASRSRLQGELSTQEVFSVLEDLHGMGVPSVILSGGEPLTRPDIFEIADRAKALGMSHSLSTNGSLINESNIDRIVSAGFEHVGVRFDGDRAKHDAFSGIDGSFDATLHGLRLCRDKGISTGVRFTLTEQNFAELPAILGMVDRERIGTFCLKHLNYAGNGRKKRHEDAHLKTTRTAVEYLFDMAWRDLVAGKFLEYFTENNDADAALLLQWSLKRFHPEDVNQLRQKLRARGGASAGDTVGTIDHAGNVHPDRNWSDHTIGNVRETAFSSLWRELQDPILQQLRLKQKPLTGRCGGCAYLDVCGGNTRTRALSLTGDMWAEDPGCYLLDEEIGWDADVTAVAEI